MHPYQLPLITDANGALESGVAHRFDTLMELRTHADLDETAQIAKIQELLGAEEALATLRKLRWPKGVVCPRCGSVRIERRDVPEETAASDFRRYYTCLDCRDRLGGVGTFDDLTGLPISTISSIQQWALCWYVLAFCTPLKAAQLLGLPIDYLLQVAVITHDLTLLPPEQRTEALRMMAFQHRANSARERRTREQSAIEKERRDALLQESPLFQPTRPKKPPNTTR